MESTMTVMGYAVEKVEGEKATAQGALAYFLRGQRGAVYGLIRYSKTPHLMFVVRGSNGHICALKGNSTFTDEGGTLRARS